MKDTLVVPFENVTSIQKNKASLVWHCNEDCSEMTDFRVYDRSIQNDVFHKTPGVVDKDIGACRDDWDSWDLENVLFYLFVLHNYNMSFEMTKRIINELQKIHEWSEKLDALVSFKHNMMDY